jgi:hypothetical protein
MAVPDRDHPGRRQARHLTTSQPPASGANRQRGVLAQASSPLVRLLDGAYRVSSHLAGSCFSGIAAVSPADRRRPLSASCLQARRRVASGPLNSAGDEQGARGTGGSALLIAESGARDEACRMSGLPMQTRRDRSAPRHRRAAPIFVCGLSDRRRRNSATDAGGTVKSGRLHRRRHVGPLQARTMTGIPTIAPGPVQAIPVFNLGCPTRATVRGGSKAEPRPGSQAI